MSSTAAEAFDRLAERYDATWTNTAVGRLQREAVWRNLDAFFPAGSHLLDVGCGTGEDAAYFQSRGLAVTAVDASPAMIARAQARGVTAQVCAIEHLDELNGTFDGALSNFGALNCVRELDGVARSLGRSIRSGGCLAVCVLGRLCLWETLYYIACGCPRKAVRRWGGAAASQSLGLRVYYPTARQLRRAFAPFFVQVQMVAIGVTVPPSYVSCVPAPLLRMFGAVDRRIEQLRIAQPIADHRLFVFVRR